jgi:holo-[acyl-carrier protein] synthase
MPADARAKKGAAVIVATGVDLVELARIERLLREQRERFVARVYTDGERAYCAPRPAAAASYAARFAAKEAVMKCLAAGWLDGVGFRQIEVVREPHGAVGVELHGHARERARALGITRIHLSLSHTGAQAIAFAVAENG